MRSAFDFGNFRRSSVGFDRLFEMLEDNNFGAENYPPFDLIKVDENRYRIEMAVAGFTRDEIEIVSQQNQLQIRGQKADNDGSNYVHRGIATRSFERRFALADHMKVQGADLKDGMLAIELVREIPEAMKPRRIEIGSSESQQIEGKVKETESQRIEGKVKETEDA